MVITFLKIAGCYYLVYAQESGNPHDPYAVTMNKGSEVVGHVSRKNSAA